MSLFDVQLPRRAFLYACALGVLIVLAIRIPACTNYFFSPPPSADASQRAHKALETVNTAPRRVRIIGYERSAFGAGWAMTTDGQGHYLNTRDLVLQRAVRAGPHPEQAIGSPKVAGDALAFDEYSGLQVVASEIEIDHIVPLAAAWDMGAWAWTPEQRQRFANDAEFNLAATARDLNREKSDATLAAWMPPDASTRCDYAARFLTVCAKYALVVAKADVDVARRACRL